MVVQAHGVSLDPAQLCVIGTCAVLAAISAAAIPSAGLVTMVMVMQVTARQLSSHHAHLCPDLCLVTAANMPLCALMCFCDQLYASFDVTNRDVTAVA